MSSYVFEHGHESACQHIEVIENSKAVSHFGVVDF